MEANVRIHYVNELKCRIECDQSIAYELYEEFGFYVDGYKFSPKFKAGIWDGKLRLFYLKTRQLFVGLLPKLVDFCQKSGYTIEFANKADFKKNRIYDAALVEAIYDTGKFVPKWYQVDAVEAILKHQKIMILSPTASGKSYITYLVCRYLLEHSEHNVVISVPTTSLVEQLYTDFQDYVADDFVVEDNVHKIYGGKEKFTNKRITISTWQSLMNQTPEWFTHYGAYICDEAHQADAKVISGIIDKLAHAPFRVGLTGTLRGSKLHELDMQAKFGAIQRVATTKDLQDSGDLAGLDIEVRQFKYSDAEIDMVKHLEYQQEIDFIVQHPERNKRLCELALNAKGNTMMFFNFIEKHGQILYEMLKPLCEAAGKPLYYIAGSVDTEAREIIRKTLETETNAILLCSYGTASTGLNLKQVHNIIFCHPFKSVIRILQTIGRGLRAVIGKQSCKLIDVADDLSYTTRGGNKKYNITLLHSIHRLEIYQSERFKYRIVKSAVAEEIQPES
jgi:superfamily II DNA or RNA helicase